MSEICFSHIFVLRTNPNHSIEISQWWWFLVVIVFSYGPIVKIRWTWNRCIRRFHRSENFAQWIAWSSNSTRWTCARLLYPWCNAFLVKNVTTFCYNNAVICIKLQTNTAIEYYFAWRWFCTRRISTQVYSGNWLCFHHGFLWEKKSMNSIIAKITNNIQINQIKFTDEDLACDAVPIRASLKDNSIAFAISSSSNCWNIDESSSSINEELVEVLWILPAFVLRTCEDWTKVFLKIKLYSIFLLYFVNTYDR